jgi:hypothetical protein
MNNVLPNGWKDDSVLIESLPLNLGINVISQINISNIYECLKRLYLKKLTI